VRIAVVGAGTYSYTAEQAQAVIKERDVAFAQRAAARS
jgi:hypothetical protein